MRAVALLLVGAVVIYPGTVSLLLLLGMITGGVGLDVATLVFLLVATTAAYVLYATWVLKRRAPSRSDRK